MRGQTIQVFLTYSAPIVIKLAEITSNIEQAIFSREIRLMKQVLEKKCLDLEFISYLEKVTTHQNQLFILDNLGIVLTE